MSKRMLSVVKGLVLILVNLIILIGLLAGLEIYLRVTDPFLRLPFDTFYYKRHRDHYLGLAVSPENLQDDVTWGHQVANNHFGFRERELDRPKPAGRCRVVVLGDSFTWGIGLAVEQRYPNLVEARLRQAFPERDFEVITWAHSGWSTAQERDALRNYKDWLKPDLIVVGFVLNDPQPRNHDYTAEKETFDRRYGETLKVSAAGLSRLGLPQTAQTTRVALDNFLVWSEILPPWEVGMQRVYERDSAEWQTFEQALRDIKGMSDGLKLPPPFFIVLNQDNFWDRPTDYTNLEPGLPVYLRWYHQAEQAAAAIGFRTYHHERELLEVSREEIPVNELDYHPSARVNQIYAEKLFASLAAEIEQGRLCQAGRGQGATAATETSLADKRLLSVRFGPQIRFLGYVADTGLLAEKRALRLTLGWQALEEVETSYALAFELTDPAGKVFYRQEALPCEGDCLTAFWPAGLIAPPDSEMVYWPEEAEMLPLPVGELPYQGELRDTHQLIFGPELPAGDYLLTLSLYERNPGDYLPAFDEISQAQLPENRVILGKVSLTD